MLAQRGQEAEQPRATLARRQRPRLGVAERDDPEPVAAPRGDVPDGERDALGDVGLPTERRTERHRGGEVEHEP